MAAFNFQPRFAPLIESGQKILTMRVDRSDGRPPAKVRDGKPLRLYTGMRTSACRLLLERPDGPTLVARVSFKADGYCWVYDRLGLPNAKATDLVRRWEQHQLATWQERVGLCHEIAAADGFGSWDDLWTFHKSVGLNEDGRAVRWIVGWA